MKTESIKNGMTVCADVYSETTIQGTVINVDENAWVSISIPCKTCGQSVIKMIHARRLYHPKTNIGD